MDLRNALIRSSSMSPITDHPLRFALANELHARPFPDLSSPCQAAFLAIKQPQNAAARDRDVDRAHLCALLDRFGAKHPGPNETHYFGDLGRFKLKWEAHTEFVSYTAFVEGQGPEAFNGDAFRVFPQDWLDAAPGVCMSSALIRVEPIGSIDDVRDKLDNWFIGESLAVSQIVDGAAVVAGDFRIDSDGHMRFGVFVAENTGSRRIGRIVQRICEIETYKTMSMLGLARVRQLNPAMGALDKRLSDLVGAMESLDSGAANGLPISYSDYERAKVAATDGQTASAMAYLKSAVAAGLSGTDRVLENEQLAALKREDGFDEVLDQLDANANPCRDEEFHQFDFWLGTWEVATANGSIAGRNTLGARESGCMLLEEWTSASGGSGTSMNYYDAISGKWTQVWISAGLQLRITGGLENGSMVLSGSAHYIQQNTTSPFRGRWTPLEDGRVRQFFEQRDADGNWSPWFEGFYSRMAKTADSD